MRWSDILERYNKYDDRGFIQEYLKWGERLRKAFNQATELEKIPRRVVFIGVGGSGIVGDIIRDYTYLTNRNIEVYVYKGVTPPRRIVRKSLVIGVSHSGNTIETINTLLKMHEYAPIVAVVTADGKLLEYAERYKWDINIIEPALAPRAGLPQMLGASLKMLNHVFKVDKRITRVAEKLDRLGRKLSIEKRYNEAYRMASFIWGYTPVIYGTAYYIGVLHRIKSSFNENSKVHSYYVVFPEGYHNEVEAYEKYVNQFLPIILRYDGDELDYLIEYFNKEAVRFLTYQMNERDILYRILKTIMFFDLVSIYLAYLRKVDPYVINVINEIKEMRR
ncbi:hypothetical protein DRN87_00445 [Candidatus Geothermarchaeota archaeon]|nr:MAG: hypothetical protein DRN87_00445 [Candidatus Geothermarchaeota archaeon]